MAAATSEIQSLEEVQYKSKMRVILMVLLIFILFVIGFVSYFPIGDKVKTILKANLSASGCNPDFNEIRMEWFLPKIVISDVSLPANCLGRVGEPLEFNYMTLNWHLVNFSPFGLPFRLDTEVSGQPISVHYVVGINQQLIRMRDQNINLAKLKPVLGEAFKLAGSVTVDLNLLMSQNLIKNLALKAKSTNFEVPAQSIQGFNLANLKINDFYLEANSENHPRINIDKMILGNPDSPIRANFTGNIMLQEENIAFSPIDLVGEVAFSENFTQSLPLIEMMFQSFTQKDGFYQVRLGGTLGAPKPLAP
jgi:type II secretion system protein N